MYMICSIGSAMYYVYVYRVSWALCACKVGGGRDPLFSGASHVEVPKRLDRVAHCAYKPSLGCLDCVSYGNLRATNEGYPDPMTRRGATHARRSREHVLCRTGRCMRHAIRNANGHGMVWDARFPTSAVSRDTMGRIPPIAQHLHARVVRLFVGFYFDTLLFQNTTKTTRYFFGLFKSYFHFS